MHHKPLPHDLAAVKYAPAVMGASSIKGSMTTLLEVKVWSLNQL